MERKRDTVYPDIPEGAVKPTIPEGAVKPTIPEGAAIVEVRILGPDSRTPSWYITYVNGGTLVNITQPLFPIDLDSSDPKIDYGLATGSCDQQRSTLYHKNHH